MEEVLAKKVTDHKVIPVHSISAPLTLWCPHGPTLKKEQIKTESQVQSTQPVSSLCLPALQKDLSISTVVLIVTALDQTS